MTTPPPSWWRAKKRKLSIAERLRQRFAHVQVAGQVASTAATDSRWLKEGVSAVKVSSTTDLNKELAKAKPAAALSRDEMNKYLAKYQNRFQGCYERALLADSSLNGKVHFSLQSGAQGRVEHSEVSFEGVGLSATRADLQDCLRGILREVQFPATMASAFNRTIQFQAVLSL